MKLRLAVVLIITALCLGWVLRGLDWGIFTASLGAFDWRMQLPIMALYGACHAMRAQRFRILLTRPLDFRTSFSILSVGYLALHVIPLRAGELVRPYLARERKDVPFGESLAVVVIERLLDVLMLLAMLLGVTWFVDLPTAIVVEGVDLLSVGQRLAGIFVAAGVAGIAVVVAVGEPVLRVTDRLPGGGMARRFREAMVALVARPAVAAEAFLLSVAIWALTILAVGLQLAAFPGIPARWDVALTTWAATLAGMAALPTPGFFGGFEAACTAALQMFDVDPSQARTFGILLHMGQFLFTIGVGALFLVWEGLSLREVVARSQEGLGEDPRPAG